MARKKAKPKVEATAAKPDVRHARVELPEADYQRLKWAAGRVHISVAGYIRQAIMDRIEADEQRWRAK